MGQWVKWVSFFGWVMGRCTSTVYLSHQSTAATAAGGFAVERPAGRRYRLIAAGALRALCCRRRRSVANAGSVVLRTDEGGSARTCLLPLSLKEKYRNVCTH